MVVENCDYLRDARVRKEAKALTTAGYSVSVICPKQTSAPWHQVIDGVSIYRFPFWRAFGRASDYFLEYACAMLAIAVLTIIVLIREGFDIIHTANPPDLIVPVTSVYKLTGKSVIYDQHDLCVELYEAKFGRASGWLRRILLWMERYSYRVADHVVVTNESYKRVAMERGLLCESKITVVRNAPETRTLNPLDVDWELRNKSPNIITFAGATGSQDGLDQLCRALHHLRFDLCRDDFYCIVVGDGDALQKTKVLARDLCIDDKMWFAGWVSDEDTYTRYISTSDICVSPSPSDTYNDRSTFIKIMEYMAAGKPIVAYDLLETRRSAQGAALYARPNNAREFAEKIARLMEDSALRRAMGEIGVLRINQKLAWKYSVVNLLKAYEKVIKSRQSVRLWARSQEESRSSAGEKVR